MPVGPNPPAAVDMHHNTWKTRCLFKQLQMERALHFNRQTSPERKPSRKRKSGWVGGDHENEIACAFLTGGRIHICRPARVLWSIRRRRVLCATATTSSGCQLRAAIRAGSRLLLGRRLLVSDGATLLLACGLLGSTALCPRVLGSTALLRSPLLFRLLAPLTPGRRRTVFSSETILFLRRRQKC